MVPSHAVTPSVSPIVWIMVTTVLVMVSGATKLPGIARDMGKSAKVSKEELKDLAEDEGFAASVSPKTSQVQAPIQATLKSENPADQSISHQDN